MLAVPKALQPYVPTLYVAVMFGGGNVTIDIHRFSHSDSSAALANSMVGDSIHRGLVNVVLCLAVIHLRLNTVVAAAQGWMM